MPNFMKNALNGGLIFGIVLVIIQLLMWMFNFVPIGIAPAIIMFLFNIVVAVIALTIFTRMYRDKELGGYISYGQSFRYGWTVYMIATVIVLIYTFIFYKFIDPEYMQRISQLTMDTMETKMRARGVSEEQISKMIDAMAERSKNPGILRTLITGLVGGAVFGVITSAISSAFSKKEANPLK